MYKNYEDVLNVRLIAYSQPSPDLIDTDLDNVRDIIGYCAKVSNPPLQNKFDTLDRLMSYLKRNAHWSPFEMASATLEITTTRDIARQILRHRSFSFQEFSQRYADVNTLNDQFVLKEARLQDATNRQNSVELTEEDSVLASIWEARQEAVIEAAKKAYDWALESGIAKEQARVVLPEGNTISKLYMQGTIRSWIHYIDLRSKNGTQKEHMLIAEKCAEAINKIFPFME